jgi:hypothetical protein
VGRFGATLRSRDNDRGEKGEQAIYSTLTTPGSVSSLARIGISDYRQRLHGSWDRVQQSV